MTSRFKPSYQCLNGPKQGDWIDAPHEMDQGCAVAVPWFNAKHILNYAVYVVTEYETQPAPVKGLMFLQSHPTPDKAQEHVHRVTMVMGAAKMAAETTN